jgi:hypothetical protein
MILHTLAGIGLLTLILLIFFFLRWAHEESTIHAYEGLKDQIDETAHDLEDVLKEEGIASIEAQWAIEELRKVARTREWRPKHYLKSALQSRRESPFV